MSLRNRAIGGVIWTVVDAFVLKGFLFCTTILLARWLGPDEFGLVGMISVFIAIGTSITDSGLSSSLIRTKNADDGDFSTVFVLNLALSFVVYVILFYSAPYIALFFDQPILKNIVRVYCLSFIFSAFSAVQLARLIGNMQFKKITKLNVPGTIVGTLTGLFLGYFGFGVWAIVGMYLSTQLVKSASLWISSNWRPSLHYSREKARYHYGFGYKLMLSGLIDTVFKNIYNILIGKFYSAQTLGYYERSKQFSEYPSSTLTGVIDKVTYPMLSQLQDDPIRLEAVYRKLIKVSFFVIAPLMLGTAAVAEPLFLLVLGDEWFPAIVFFQILSLAMMLYPIHSFNLNILKVHGRSDLFLKLEIIKKVVTVVAVVLGFQFGVIGLVWASVFTSFIALGINMYYSSKLINYPIFEQVKDLSSILILALITALLMFQVTNLMHELDRVFQLIVATVIGVLFYTFVSYFNRRSPLHHALSLIKSRNL